MTIYYVLSEPCSNDHWSNNRIVTSIHNPKPGQIIAEFPVPEIPFDPMTYLLRLDEVEQLHRETRQKAEAFLQSQK